MTDASLPRALLFGASGLLGRCLAHDLGAVATLSTPSAQEVDLSDAGAVSACIAQEDPEVVVIAAGLSRVAVCEADPARSEAVNVDGVRHVVACARTRRVVLFSTDAVFDGSRPAFAEADPPNPGSVYGRHKTAAERLVRALPRHLILRSARFYGRTRGDGRFVDHVATTLAAGGRIEAPRDTPGNPTFVDDLSRATRDLIVRAAEGTWHLAGPTVASLYETAIAVAESFDFDPARVVPVARDHGSATPRLTSVLDTSKAHAAGLHLRPLREALDAIRRDAP